MVIALLCFHFDDVDHIFNRHRKVSVMIQIYDIYDIFLYVDNLLQFSSTFRFKYPERPIVFLSACYFMVSIGYLTRSVLGHEEVACDGATLSYHASGPTPCTLVFLLVYFFGMASSIW